MRTITTNLYEFKELSKEAQDVAIELVTPYAYKTGHDCEWEEANQVIKDFEKLSRVHADIEWSSHGYYCNHITDYVGDLTDEEDVEYWGMLKDKIFAWSADGGYWEDELRKQFLKFVLDTNKSYQRNVANFLVEFCESVDEYCLCYYDRDNAKSYIRSNDLEFYEDGTAYNF